MQIRNRTLIAMIVSIVLGYLPWYNFSAVLKYIAQDLNLTLLDTGFIISAFQAGYVVMVLFTGWLADKIGTKKVVASATLLTGIFSLLFAFLARDFNSTLILRVITGATSGAIYAPGMALLSNWFPPNERGKALGGYTAGLVAAYAGGYFVAGPIAVEFGWRSGIIATSIPVFLAFVIIILFVEEKPKETGIQFDGGLVRNSQADPSGGWAGPILVTASYMGHMWELYAFWGWVGPFLISASLAVGYSAQSAGIIGSQLAALIVLIGAPASFLWGMIADKFGRTKSIIVASICSLTANTFFGYLYGQNLWLIIGVGLWIGFWIIADSAIYKVGLTEMTSPKIRTTLLGIQSAIGYSMTIFAPIIFGKVLQVYNGSVNPAEAKNWGPAFLVLGLGALISPIFALLLRIHPQSFSMGAGKR